MDDQSQHLGERNAETKASDSTTGRMNQGDKEITLSSCNEDDKTSSPSYAQPSVSSISARSSPDEDVLRNYTPIDPFTLSDIYDSDCISPSTYLKETDQKETDQKETDQKETNQKAGDPSTSATQSPDDEITQQSENNSSPDIHTKDLSPSIYSPGGNDANLYSYMNENVTPINYPPGASQDQEINPHSSNDNARRDETTSQPSTSAGLSENRDDMSDEESNRGNTPEKT